MPHNLLQIEGLEVGYGDIQILRGVSVSLNLGERIGLFGPNGHGKTTLLQTVSGFLKPWKGEIRLEGQLLNDLQPRKIVELGIAHVPQGNTLFPRMTVSENLYAGAYVRRAWAERKKLAERVYSLFPILAKRKNQLSRTLSGGERQMLAIGAGLMANGKVLLLDEPTMGLSPLVKQELNKAIDDIAKSKVPLILVEQDFKFLSSLTDRFYLIEKGRVVFEGKPSCADSSQIIQMYFGRAIVGNGNRRQTGSIVSDESKIREKDLEIKTDHPKG